MGINKKQLMQHDDMNIARIGSNDAMIIHRSIHSRSYWMTLVHDSFFQVSSIMI